MSNTKTKKMKRRYLALASILFVIGICCGVWFVFLSRNDSKTIDKQVEKVKEFEEFDVIETPEIKEPLENPIDFDALTEINADIYAWISIPGTEIEYPILQAEKDNSFYLRRGLDKKRLMSGVIFTENYNSKDFNDFNTLIYGHCMSDRTMFGSLLDFYDKAFFDEHKQIIIYTPNEMLVYEIFAAYPFDDRHIMVDFDFSSLSGRESYLDLVFGIRDMKAHINYEKEILSDGNIITLSTCNKTDESRYLVQGVLVSREELR